MSHIDRGDEQNQDQSEPLAVEQPDAGRQPQLLQAVGGAALVAAVAWLLQRLRRRRQPTSSERLAEATRALGAASVGFAGRAAGRATEVVAPVAERTGDLAMHSVRAGVEGATKAANTAGPLLATGAGVAAREAGRVGSTLADVPHRVAEGGEKVHRAWIKWTGRLILSLAAGTGYVLGARAGRGRYEQIVRVANDVARRPEVQQARQKLGGLASGRGGGDLPTGSEGYVDPAAGFGGRPLGEGSDDSETQPTTEGP
jgi:hypothetical protein